MSFAKQLVTMIVLLILAVTLPSFYFNSILGIKGTELTLAYSMVAIFLGIFFILAIFMMIRSRLYS